MLKHFLKRSCGYDKNTTPLFTKVSISTQTKILEIFEQFYHSCSKQTGV